MKIKAFEYVSDCNKHGIRIYPVLKYGKYQLVVEFNKSSEFLPHEIIRTRMGEVRYPTETAEWSNKMLELYEHLYKTKVVPKLSAA